MLIYDNRFRLPKETVMCLSFDCRQSECYTNLGEVVSYHARSFRFTYYRYSRELMDYSSIRISYYWIYTYIHASEPSLIKLHVSPTSRSLIFISDITRRLGDLIIKKLVEKIQDLKIEENPYIVNTELLSAWLTSSGSTCKEKLEVTRKRHYV